MMSVNTLLEKISYKEIITSLMEVMAANFEDFSADQERFNKTISILAKEKKDATSLSVDEMVEAINQQIGSCLLFSFFLGFKANLDHFIDPIGRTFLEVDSETYLREDVARRLPEYQNALLVLEHFYAALSPAQQDLYEDITTYISHLETVGPKLAHYYGYLLGNQLYPRIIPGYGEDLHLTLQYRHILENQLGVSIKQIFNSINSKLLSTS